MSGHGLLIITSVGLHSTPSQYIDQEHVRERGMESPIAQTTSTGQ